MKAYRICAPGGPAAWQEVTVPAPAADQVLIQMEAAGICRTDLEIIDHGRQLRPWVGPYTLGHEDVGRVVDIGSAVTQFQVDDPVLVFASGACGACRNCRCGHDNYCLSRPRIYGISHDGGLAPYMVAREHDLLLVPPDLELRMAAPLGDAGATAYGAVDRALPTVDDNGFVVVVGIGGLGVFALQLLRLKTTATIIAVDHPGRLELAKRRGAHIVVPSDEHASDAILEISHDRGVDAVIDLVGVDQTLALAARVTRSLGRVVLVGTGGGSVPFTFGATQLGVELVTQASCSRQELADLLQIAARGLLTIDAVFYPFDELEKAWDDLRQGRISGRGVMLFG